MESTRLTRRESLVALGAVSAGALAWGVGPRATAQPTEANRERALRIAHLTDIHVEPERRAPSGLAACLHHVQSLADKPDLVLTGGDHVMDTFDADDARAKVQWDFWAAGLKSGCSLPVRSCIGNHDIWGWGKQKSKTTGLEANWGKQRAIEALQMPGRYYTFAQDGWRFIVLDSVQTPLNGGEGYNCYLDDEQYAWLENTLRDNPSEPIAILSHVPIITITSLLWSAKKGNDFQVGSWIMHGDCLKLKDLFAKHPQVKLCLSGHTHLLDRIDYNGVSYLCNGAVCGNWWKGRFKDCDEGYATLNLYRDGTFDHEYIKYGWKAET